MTHSLSTFDADRPPAMYRSATLAIVVSSTSMNVGTTTATATNQGLIAGRLTAVGARVALLIAEGSFTERAGCERFSRPARSSLKGRRGLSGAGGRRCEASGIAGGRWALRERVERLQDVAGVRPGGRSP